MKQRMITVFYGIALLLVVLFFYNSVVLNAAIAIVCGIAVYEIFAATKCNKNILLMVVSIAFAMLVPFISFYRFKGYSVMVFFAFMFVVFCILLLKHQTINLDKAALCLIVTILFTASMSCMIVIRDQFMYTSKPSHVALFFIVLVFIAAWITDGGGYIFGRLFGKHKMSPTISPKKTVEGAVGGVVSNVIISTLLLFGYSIFLKNNGITAQCNYLSIVLLSIACALVSIIGDLSASLIKRENGIKDFGNILPGHGGMLDRFDSIIFVAPLILAWVRFFPIVSF